MVRNFDFDGLSEDDKKLVLEIEKIERDEGYISWYKMDSLARKLKDGKTREHILGICKMYYHIEEDCCGCL